MAKRARWQGPSLMAVAEKAGVSASTVDRVINQRPHVSEKSREAVARACRQLRLHIPYLTEVAEGNYSTKGPHLSLVLISDAGATLNERLQAAADLFNSSNLNARLQTHLQETKDFDALLFAERILEAARGANGLIINSRDDPIVRRAIDQVVESGVPVICHTTDIPDSSRLAYIGMNQFSAGATAAYLIGRFATQRDGVVVLSASAPYVCQEQRESGFRRVLRADFPMLSVQECINSLDDVESAYASMSRTLERTPNPLAVYNVAGGNPGIAKALEEAGLIGKTIFVGHEGSESSMRLLETNRMDAVIAHDIEDELRRTKLAFEAYLRKAPLPEEALRTPPPMLFLKPMLVY